MYIKGYRVGGRSGELYGGDDDDRERQQDPHPGRPRYKQVRLDIRRHLISQFKIQVHVTDISGEFLKSAPQAKFKKYPLKTLIWLILE